LSKQLSKTALKSVSSLIYYQNMTILFNIQLQQEQQVRYNSLFSTQASNFYKIHTKKQLKLWGKITKVQNSLCSLLISHAKE